MQHGFVHAVSNVAVNTAETFIASGSLDATVRLWNIGPGSRVALKVANMAVEEVCNVLSKISAHSEL